MTLLKFAALFLHSSFSINMRANLREALDRVLFGPNRSEPEPEIETFEAEDSAKWSTENNKTATSPGNNGARSSAQSELHEVSQKLSWPTYEATWDPSPFQVRPLVGLAALCVAIACVFASLAILIIANGSLVSHWPIQPNVYLAVVTAIANGSIALAKMEATPVSSDYIFDACPCSCLHLPALHRSLGGIALRMEGLSARLNGSGRSAGASYKLVTPSIIENSRVVTKILFTMLRSGRIY